MSLFSIAPMQNESAASEAAVQFAPLGAAINVLMVWPRFPASFWGFQGMMSLLPEKTAMPPLGLITVAALCPKSWNIRLIDRAFDQLPDADLHWADLVMVSGMHVQKGDIADILLRARSLGKRTIVGGPYASSEPEVLLELADHVVVGEPDEEFDKIALDLETGTARRLYVVEDKPDVSKTPTPRFDLLKLENYVLMSVQFSRGCPFQCEFCDIITLYGRKPRTKQPRQLLKELQALVDFGWRKPVFVVDDNFIGNHKLALALTIEMEEWQKARNYPLMFFTEASIDLAQKPELIEAMVRANFFFVFVGIESPSKEALTEAKKFQNLRVDPLESIRTIQSKGLWVCGGFILGFDSDTPDIFEQQKEFIESAAIPWAMAGFLQAPPTTPLYARMKKQGRLLEESTTSNFDPPNFRTMLPLPVLLRGFREVLTSLYAPPAFYNRAYRSLLQWNVGKQQKGAPISLIDKKSIPVGALVATFLRSIFQQGVCSSYRWAYWTFLLRLLGRWTFNPPKLSLGFTILLSGHHFISYAKSIVTQLEAELGKAHIDTAPLNAAAIGAAAVLKIL
jgi:radical SAM superfamily enzyme YgiQ (UPF0313 family)